ncbi:hypothetical protein GF324_09415, partial [bacterium]|nr:hypothetical protein [bacterium]
MLQENKDLSAGEFGTKILARLDEIAVSLAHILHDEQAGVESRYLKSIATLLARTVNTREVLDTIMDALHSTV